MAQPKTEEELKAYRAKRAAYMRVWLSKNKERVNAQRRSISATPEGRQRKVEARVRYYQKNKDKVEAASREWRKNNPEKYFAAGAAYRAKNRERLLVQKREWYAANKERHLQKQREWKLRNPNWASEWRKKNIDRVRSRHREYGRMRRAVDPVFAIRASMRSRTWALLKKAGARKDTSLGLTASDLRAHLEPMFQPGMTWDNYGKVWHVDHIKPCALFDFTDPGQVRACFSLSNLQPLWAAENIRKSDQYPYVPQQTAA